MAYGWGQLMSVCGTSTFTILAMTREMREAIPGSRSSLGAAKAGVERATSSKATETVLFDMIPPNVPQRRDDSHHPPTPTRFAYGCGKLRSPCGTSTFTILAMTREMREAIPGSRSSLGAAKAGVERATSSKATETVLFDMIPPNVPQRRDDSHHPPALTRFAYGCGKLMSPCGTSTFTILAMTREMREAIPGSRSSLGAAKAGVERATSSKATETILFDMIPPMFRCARTILTTRPRRLASPTDAASSGRLAERAPSRSWR